MSIRDVTPNLADQDPSVLARSGRRRPDLTVVVPTRNERNNIVPLMRRLEQVAPHLEVEVLFVDDSTDDTPRMICAEAARSTRSIRLIHRLAAERRGGLGGAVHAGLSAANSDLVCVMDADLQHPPEVVEALVNEANTTRVDAVVASRFCEGGDVGQFSRLRTLISRGSALLARCLFPRRLWGLSDPMSGFFVIRRSSIALNRLQPRGFKILLEILLAGSPLTTSEVPFRFGERHAGGSKASIAEGARYVRRLLELRLAGRTSRLLRFGAVGAFGVGVNAGALYALAYPLHVWYPAASVLATEAAILVNYALSELVVFRASSPTRSIRVRFLSYAALNNATLVVTLPVLVLLVSVLGLPLTVANLIALIAVALIRFDAADRYVWGTATLRRPAPPPQLPIPSRQVHSAQAVALETPERQA